MKTNRGRAGSGARAVFTKCSTSAPPGSANTSFGSDPSGRSSPYTAERAGLIRRTGRGVGERATISTEWPIVCRARIVLSAALASPLPRASAARFVTTSVFNPLCILARSPSGAFAKWVGAFGLVDFWVMPERPRPLVTGITGQDGSYLAELRIETGYAVRGRL